MVTAKVCFTFCPGDTAVLAHLSLLLKSMAFLTWEADQRQSDLPSLQVLD